MDFLDTLYQQTQNSIGYDLAYDLFKVIVGFLFARFIYEKVIMELQWGGREVVIKRGGEALVQRKLSPDVAKRIETDATDFSVYIKGIVSPFTWLNIDVSSLKAEDLGLVCKQGKLTTIDISKNPHKKKTIADRKQPNTIQQHTLESIIEQLTALQESYILDSGAMDRKSEKTVQKPSI